MYLCISEEEREKAVQILIGAVLREMLLQIYDEISKEPDRLIIHHFGIDIEIRNLLRAKGFAWDDATLDHEWEPTALEAARRVYEDARYLPAFPYLMGTCSRPLRYDPDL